MDGGDSSRLFVVTAQLNETKRQRRRQSNVERQSNISQSNVEIAYQDGTKWNANYSQLLAFLYTYHLGYSFVFGKQASFLFILTTNI